MYSRAGPPGPFALTASEVTPVATVWEPHCRAPAAVRPTAGRAAPALACAH